MAQTNRVDQVDQVDQVGLGLVGLGQVGERALLQRIRAEFLEMPGLTLTLWQATRLWNVDAGVCEAVLDVLVRGRFLTQTRHGAFRRLEG